MNGMDEQILACSEHDMRNVFSVVNEYLSQPKDPRPDPSSTDEFKKWLDRQCIFKMCYDTVADLVVRETFIVACTNSLAGSHIARRNFGANDKPIIVTADEDGQALEPDVIIPLVSLDMA